MSEMLRVLDRGYELIWREDRIEHALRGLGPDFDWIVPDHPEGARRRGPDAAIEFFHDWRSQFADLEVNWELEDRVGAGRALALTSTTGRGRVSGAPVEMRFAQLWTWRDGRFVRMLMADTPLVAILRDSGEALQREGVEAILPCFTEDVLWEDDPDWPDAQVWHGREGVRRAFEERFDATSIAIDFEETTERDRRVLGLLRWDATGVGSGATAVLRPAMVVDFDGYMIRRTRFFLDRDRARDAFEAD